LSIRVGNGFDVHKLKEGTPLFLGGILIPYKKGSLGHSDGDVLIHSIVDAIFGALALGDLGLHFPSNDDKWKGAKSQIFLEYAFNKIKEKEFLIQNIDSTIILQKPIISHYILPMRKKIGEILSMNIDDISIKATTTDGLGYIGRGEGIAAQSVLLLANGN
jgi:2-C-methyl-D-erythritol 2,4-cyclodiphosphate synthase